ncbi:MAG: N-acetylmuramic acid 6-phosphate etherase [Flavobacteriales bacterium]|jgi:N-acetylmuramic acid 6-phosphate etherase|nr:N-acetylmuramic acid 6-phosphate etherase [Flavobacteriales bacterium]MBQ1968402.1 N-acetylmuramic acid 6-phosphate etherase [Flavobacteriales bacterium]MBQ5814628.1 N-acetylmuramic acid 6-phosphate etherase [Flavobacteriales bacterium]MBR4401999.1 N-acetylmuramic acid 6-phosphate etherase [Flavobacteriales bacterium]
MKYVTESESNHKDLDKKSAEELLRGINQEDKTVAFAVEQAIPAMTEFVEKALPRMKEGGRLFYIGAGTSGRLGIVDASEIPPTYGMAPGVVVGIMAGGDYAIRNAVEGAEDDFDQSWVDLQAHNITPNDIVVGIAASGRTPYVIGGLRNARQFGCLTGAIACNPGSPIAAEAEVAMEAVVGPEFVTGSTRMKSGTAQKLMLNMISTSLMIQLGCVVGNRMVDMQLTNEKLVDRGTKMVLLGAPALSYEEAQKLLLQEGSVRKAVDFYNKNLKK